MTRREKILAAMVLLLLAGWGAKSLFGRYQNMVDQRRSELLAARQQLADAQLALARGHRAVEQMERWQEQSLPADRDVALSLYRARLLDELKAAGLTVDDVKPDLRSARSAAFTSIGCLVEARGTLGAVAAMLHEFYRSAQLHQITRLRLRPVADASQLSVSMQVEALVLPGAIHRDTLPDGIADRLSLASVDEYRKSVEDRNLFAAYGAAPAQVSGNESPSDDAQHAYVTGIVQTGGRLQAWITVRSTGEVLRLFEGDALKVGLLEGRIVSIGPRVVVVKSGDEQFSVELGDSLRQEDKKTSRGGDKETS